MRALVAKLIRKCLRGLRSSGAATSGQAHLSISVLSSPIFSLVKGMFTLANGLSECETAHHEHRNKCGGICSKWLHEQRYHWHDEKLEPAEVNNHACERLIQRCIRRSKSSDVFTVSEGSCKRKAQRNTNVL